MKRRLHTFFFTIALLLLSSELFSQTAPNITYASPQALSSGTAVTITPTNSGGAVPATTTYRVTTFAGSTSGTAGNTDGTGTAASFNQPRGISSDASGNLYITEATGNRIRKITPAAVVTLFAGNAAGTSGSANGTGSASSFFTPFDITTDPSGNFYVADYDNNLIRKITPAGVVTNYATVTHPAGIIYDALSGSFVVSRFTNNDLVKVSLAATTGVVTAFVGSGTAGNANGTGAAASFNGPNGLTDDGAGNIYLADQGNNQIRKITSAGAVTLFAGSTAGTAGSTDGTGNGALFNTPRSLVTDASGNIYVSDNNIIRMITSARVVSTIAGSGTAAFTDGIGTAAAFNAPRGLQFDATTGNIYVCDFNNNAIRKLTPSGYTLTGTLPAGLSFNSTTGVISGTPTTISPTTTYTITATNAYGTSTTTLAVGVGPGVTTPAAICGAGTVATMTASGGSPAGGVYNWYTSATGGTLVNTGTTYAPTLVTTTTFYVDYTVSGTTSARTAVTATMNPKVSSPVSGTTIAYSFSGDTRDVSGNQNDGILQNAPTLTTDRYNAASSAYNFNGTNQWITTTKQVTDPQNFSISVWFNTTTTSGGKIVGFSQGQDGGGQFDRHIYMTNTGQIYYGVYSGGVHTINTTASYNNGQWHHVVVTQSTTNGMKLYVDGVLQASNTTYTAAEPHNGYWNIGGNQISGWTPTPTSAYFAGKIDDVAIFSTELSGTTITSAAFNDLNTIGAYAPVCVGSAITLYSPTITGATYTWTDPKGVVVSGTSTAITFPAAVAGAYSLSVTGGPGGCTSTATYTPTVSSLPTAAFTAPSAVDVNATAAITLTGTADPTLTYSWSFNGGTPATATGSGPFSVQWATTGLKTVTLTVTNTTGCSAVITKTVAVGASSLTGYAFKKQLILNTTSAGISNDQTNFPALVYIQDNSLIVNNTCNNKVQYPLGNYNGAAAGTNYDFAFLDPTTATELNYQVESYNSTTGTLLVWVKLPTFYAKTNNTLSFYFGSLTPAHSATFYNNTWASDYLAVYHFNESPSAGTVLDATNNAVNGTPTNITTGTDAIRTAAGLSGGAYNFTKASGSKIITTKKADITGNAFTLSAWVSVTTPANDNKVVSNELNFGPGYKLAVKTNAIETETRSTNIIGTEGNLGRGGTVTTGWHYIQGTFNGTAFTNYLDGVAVTTSLLKTASSMTPLAGDVVAIGIDHRSGTNVSDENFYDGLMDEVRISNVIKSADWIKAEYVNQTTPLTFTDYSAAVTVNQANAAAIPGALVYTYTGVINGNFTDATNWTNTTSGVANIAPATDGTSTLIIPTGKSINLNTNAAIYGLTLDGTATLNLSGFTLSVACNIYNNNNTNGGILYNGSTASQLTWNGTLATQSYVGVTTSFPAQVGSMTVNNTNASTGVINVTGGRIDIDNLLTMTKGTLAIGSSATLTLKSNSSSTASVAALPAGTAITGIVNVERYLSGGSTKDPSTGRWIFRNYRLMSSPVNTVASNTDPAATYPYSFKYLANSAIVTGAIGGYRKSTNTFNATVAEGNPTIYLHRENKAPSNANFTAGNFTGVTDITSSTVNTTDGSKTVSVGNGFMFFFRGNNTTNLTTTGGNKTTSPYVAVEPVTFTATGYLNQGTYQVKHWYTGTTSLLYTSPGFSTIRGFNLVGNPYASSIDWEKFATTGTSGIVGTNISTTIYIFNPQTNLYNTYKKGDGGIGKGTDLTTPNGITNANIIPSGQGFFVRATAASPTLTFYETAKTATQVNGSNLLLSTAKPAESPTPQYMRLLLMKDSLNKDDNLIFFNETADLKYDEAEDAEYMPGNNPAQTISSLSSDGVKLAINRFSLPKNNESRVVKLNITAANSGIYQLSSLMIKGVADIYDFWLKDNLKHDSLDIKHNKTYNFNIDKADSTTFGANRFELVIRQNKDKQIRLLDFGALKVTNGVKLNWKTENESNYTNFTIERSTDNGKTYDVVDGFLSNASGEYSIIDKKPVAGLNQYRLKQDDINGAITYSKVINMMYANTSAVISGSFSIYPNPATSDINVDIFDKDAAKSYSIRITNSSGMIMRSAITTEPTWHGNISALMPGTYVIHVFNNQTKKDIGTGKFLKL